MEGSNSGSGDLDWTVALEASLIEGCDSKTLQYICNGRSVPATVRPDVWQIALEIEDIGDRISTQFDGLFDLEEQDQIRDDCNELVGHLGNTESERPSIASDVESVLTFYCKRSGRRYHGDNGWRHLLKPLLAQSYSRSVLYNSFEALVTRYLPRSKENSYALPCQLFRLLLLYHDPELCTFLDSKRVTVDDYFTPWFKSLFSIVCGLDTISTIWDIYFLQDDSFFVFYLSLVLLINSRSLTLTMLKESKEEVIDFLVKFPEAISSEDVKDLCELAHYYNQRTPQSFRNVGTLTHLSRPANQLARASLTRQSNSAVQTYKPAIYTTDTPPSLPQQLCLPVHVSELLAPPQMSSGYAVHYRLTDCRPAEQYNAGHLSTAYHLDFNLMLTRPEEFDAELKSLLNSQVLSAVENDRLLGAGEHLCFIGSGDVNEDQYLHMIISNLLRRNAKYISICVGGYKDMHKILMLREEIDSKITDHNENLCLSCLKNGQNRKPTNIEIGKASLINRFGLLSTAVKTKSTTMKEKVISYIKNEQATSNCHVSPDDVIGKRYRNMQDVFTMGDDDEDELTDASDLEKYKLEPPTRDYENLSVWLQKSDVIYSCTCLELRPPNEQYDSILAVTEDCLVVLRVVSRKPNLLGYVTVTRPLDSVVKISSKKSCPERISFKYGERDMNGNSSDIVISACDRFLIPRASEAIKLIKSQIEKLIQ